MKFERNEILTGLLVVVTLSLLVGVILLLAAPGVFRRQDTFQIFFDNAAAIKPGAPVLVAGHQIGRVAAIDAPVPRAQRPAKYPDAEALITVHVKAGSVVYRNATPRMAQNGLLGEQIIDFVGGTEDSGNAGTGFRFVGERVPDLNSALPRVLAVIEPVATSATLTLAELRKTIDVLNNIFGREGELSDSLVKLRLIADNLTQLTKPDGALGETMDNLQGLTGKLRDERGPLMVTLNNLERTTTTLNENHRLEKLLDHFEGAGVRAEAAARNANALLAGIRPAVVQTTQNLEQMSDTLKHQPWRILWPATKKYDPAAQPPGPKPAPVVEARRVRRVHRE